MKWKLWSIVVLILALAAWAGSYRFKQGQLASKFSLATLSGGGANLADQKGNVVVLDFWATWCGPCRMSLPHVQKLSADRDRAARGLVVWAINEQENQPTISKFLIDNQFDFPVAMDSDGAVGTAYGVEGIPMTFIVGRDGRIRNTFEGYSEDLGEQVDAAVDKALAEPRPG